MTRKIFVSYKYRDLSVKPLPGEYLSTARDYVDRLDKILSGDHIYKGEDNDDDLSHLSEEAIALKLCDRIYDSSLTIVIISPQMNNGLPERHQWIPWEVSYSLREVSRGGRVSQTNALLGVVLPDKNLNYSYFMSYNAECNSTMFKTDFLFPILRKNMFNQKKPDAHPCNGNMIFSGNHSYFRCVQWDTFISDYNYFINQAYALKELKDNYNIVKLLE